MAKSTYVPSRLLGLEVGMNENLQFAGNVIAASLLVAVCSHISLPLFFTPVPLTLQPFAVILIGLMLNPAAAFSAMVLYLMEGASGLPVFTPQGPGGLLQLFGLTGGYLLSYPLAAAVTSWLSRRLNKNFGTAAFAAAVGNLLILLCGTLWLMAHTHLSFATTAAQ
jgi:biotin transport system substrate-specific component